MAAAAWPALALHRRVALAVNDFQHEDATGYVLGGARPREASMGDILAVYTSSHTIKVYDLESLNFRGQVADVGGPIRECCFASTNANLILASCMDGRVRGWDTRQRSEVFSFSANDGCDLLSLGVNAEDSLVASGGTDGLVYFWDLRLGQPLRVFEELHGMPVSQVRFLPGSNDTIVSAAEDGLICISTVASADENDALLHAFNEEQSVASIGLFGPENEYLYCTTRVETLSLWSIQQDELLVRYESPAPRSAPEDLEVAYIAGVFYEPNGGNLFLHTANYSGDLITSVVGAEGINSVGAVSGGHSSTIRLCLVEPSVPMMITGGEDGYLCQYKLPQPADSEGGDPSPGKAPVVPKRKKAGFSPY